MKIMQHQKVIVDHVVAFTCDVCKVVYDNEMEMQEFLSIDFVAGYGSVFGDGNKIEADVCQHCLKKLLGPYLSCKT